MAEDNRPNRLDDQCSAGTLRFNTLLLALLKDCAVNPPLEETPESAEKFAAALCENGLGSLAYHLSSGATRPFFSALLAPKLKQHFIAQGLKSSRVLSAMNRLKELFAGAGIELLFLKGLMASKAFYDDLWVRSFGDLDVMIRRADFARANALLRQNGFEPRTIFFPWRSLAMGYALHHCSYHDRKLLVELHWRLCSFPFFKLNAEDLWEQGVAVELDGGAVFKGLGLEYELLLQCLSLFMDFQNGKLSYRHFIEIYRVLKTKHSTVDWTEFFQKREAEGTAVLCRHVLYWVLEFAQSHDEFPELNARLAGPGIVVPPEPVMCALSPIGRFRALRNKAASLRLYGDSYSKALLWGLLSRPSRLCGF